MQGLVTTPFTALSVFLPTVHACFPKARKFNPGPACPVLSSVFKQSQARSNACPMLLPAFENTFDFSLSFIMARWSLLVKATAQTQVLPDA